MPNWLPAATTRAVADQVVNESGYLTLTVAVPSASVFTSGNHRIVERKSLRTCTAGSCPGAGGGASAADTTAGKFPNPRLRTCLGALTLSTTSLATPAFMLIR